MRAWPTSVAIVLALALTPVSAIAQDEEPPEDQTEEEGTAPAAEGEEPAPSDDPFRDFDRLETQEFARPGAARRATGPLELMDRTELREEGFEFGAESDATDTSTALMLAVSAGAAVHGVGHFYMGDPRTGVFLLAMEGVALGLIGSSAVYYGLTSGESAAAAFFAPALQLGTAMFAYSYLLDVVGTLQSEDVRLSANTVASRGIGFRARYGLFNALGFPLRHLIDGMLLGDIGGFYASAATTQDLFLDAASYRGRVGVRPLRGGSQLTFLALESRGEFFEYQGDGEFGRITAEGRVGASYQLGDAYPQLDQFAIHAQAGFGYRWYQLAPTGSTTFENALNRPFVPFEVGASLNLTDRLNLRGGYGTSDSSWVPALDRMLGVANIEFVYRSSNFGDISLRSEIGDGFGLWLGGSFWLLR